jgi:hypothetical protein
MTGSVRWLRHTLPILPGPATGVATYTHLILSTDPLSMLSHPEQSIGEITSFTVTDKLRIVLIGSKGVTELSVRTTILSEDDNVVTLQEAFANRDPSDIFFAKINDFN